MISGSLSTSLYTLKIEKGKKEKDVYLLVVWFFFII